MTQLENTAGYDPAGPLEGTVPTPTGVYQQKWPRTETYCCTKGTGKSHNAVLIRTFLVVREIWKQTPGILLPV
jgi:hypothetical protein